MGVWCYVLGLLLTVVGGFAALGALYLAVFFATFAYCRARALAHRVEGRNRNKESEHGEGQ